MRRNHPSLADLNKTAEVDIDNSKALKLYLRSGEMVFKQANVYFLEADKQRAYVLYLKFSNLVVKEFPKHKEYRLAVHSQLLSKLKRDCLIALERLEVLKPALQKEYDDYQKEIRQKKLEEEKRSEEIWSREEHRLREEQRLREEKPTHPENYSTPPILIEPIPQAEEFVVNYPPDLPPRYDSISPTDSSMSPIAPPEELEVKVEHRLSLFGDDTMRSLILPVNTAIEFLNRAQSNTKRNIETCGILCGTLKNNSFVVTTVLIPKQKGTSDQCSMEGEEQVFEHLDQAGLLTLGWIHTHPSQSCFLSSIDLHTHYGYQQMLPEAIAIVCAPSKDPSLGVFRLTPKGMVTIRNCPLTGFHPHESDAKIYEDVDDQQSVFVDHSLPIDIVDLR